MKFLTLIFLAMFAATGCGRRAIESEVQVAGQAMTLPTTITETDKAVGVAQQRLSILKDHRRNLQIRGVQNKLYLVMLLGILLAIGGGACAFFVPGARKWGLLAAGAGIAIAALAWVFAMLVPYLIWVGLALIVAGIWAYVRGWRLDRKSVAQVVERFETYKPFLTTSYKNHFRQGMDTAVQANVEKIRDGIAVPSSGR